MNLVKLIFKKEFIDRGINNEIICKLSFFVKEKRFILKQNSGNELITKINKIRQKCLINQLNAN
jgi:hypothetical protein